MRNLEQFKNRLKTLREARGLSRIALERLASISKGNVSRLEQGAAPSPDTLQKIAHALDVSLALLTEGTDLGIKPAPPPAWVDRHCGKSARWVRPEQTLERRLNSTLSAFPRIVRGALQTIEGNPYREQWTVHYRDLWTDSNPEVLLWLRVIGRSSVPFWMSMLEANFRLHPVICPHQEIAFGDIPVPCIATTEPVQALWFPQVTLHTGFKQRPDAVVVVGDGRALAIAVDGDGHRTHLDETRERALCFPTLRLTLPDLQGSDLMRRLASACEAARLGSGRKAA